MDSFRFEQTKRNPGQQELRSIDSWEMMARWGSSEPPQTNHPLNKATQEKRETQGTDG